MSWNVLSLVLACSIGWSLLLVGYLPVSSVRRLAAEPVRAAGAWAVVAVTAPPAIFHWYLIFAIISLVAWTKLERPAGKIWLAVAAALGLSLGVVFPLETSVELLGLKNPLALASLYLGGATAGFAYLAYRITVETHPTLWQGCARWLALCAVAWTALLVSLLGPTLSLALHRHLFPANVGAPLVLAGGLTVLAVLTWQAGRRGVVDVAHGLAAATACLALGTNLLAELALRAHGPLLATPH